MKKKRLLISLVGCMAALLLSLIAISTCHFSRSQVLSFESLATKESALGYSERTPDLLIITSSQEITNNEVEITYFDDLSQQIQNIDFQKNFVVVVLRGLLSGWSPKHTVEILQVKRAGKNVVIKTHFGSPGPEDLIQMSFSSPFRIIVVSKNGKWNRDINFILEIDGKEVVKRSHFIQ